MVKKSPVAKKSTVKKAPIPKKAAPKKAPVPKNSALTKQVTKPVVKEGSKQAFINALIKKEQALEVKGGKKTKQEIGLEKAITKLIGKKYIGKR